MTRELRDYQREAVDAVYADWAVAPIPTGVILPTGCGKSTIVAQHCVDEARAGGRTLVLGEREDWLGNILSAVSELDPGVTTGWAQQDKIQARRQVIGGMVQTLQSERRRRQLIRPTKLIVDECDLAVAPRYGEIMAWAGCGEGTRTFGVTATMATATKPKPGQRGLGDVWPRIAYQRDIHWAVQSGWLVPPRGKVVVAEHLDLARAKIRAGDYQDADLGEMVAQDLPEIVGAWLEHAEHRKTAAYWPTVAVAQAAADAFNAAGIKSEVVTGTTPQDARREIYERTRLGVTQVLHSVGVLTRGWDLPELECILMARPTKSTPLYQQIVGRGLRPAPWVGKTDCLVLDVVGASRVNGLATLLQLYRAAKVQDDRPAPPLTYCDRCSYPKPAPGLNVSPLCACPPVVTERDPHGGRTLLRAGEARYVEHDLFSGPGLLWQTTRRRGRLFVAAGDRLGVLWPEPGGLFSAAHLAATGTRAGSSVAARFDIRPLGSRLELEDAKAAVEAWAQSYAAADLAERAAERAANRRAPRYLVARAQRCGVAGADRMTVGRVREEIDLAVASARLDVLG